MAPPKEVVVGGKGESVRRAGFPDNCHARCHNSPSRYSRARKGPQSHRRPAGHRKGKRSVRKAGAGPRRVESPVRQARCLGRAWSASTCPDGEGLDFVAAWASRCEERGPEGGRTASWQAGHCQGQDYWRSNSPLWARPASKPPPRTPSLSAMEDETALRNSGPAPRGGSSHQRKACVADPLRESWCGNSCEVCCRTWPPATGPSQPKNSGLMGSDTEAPVDSALNKWEPEGKSTGV